MELMFKRLLLLIFLMVLNISLCEGKGLSAEHLFELGRIEGGPKETREGVGSLIQRHPLLNHARNLFNHALKVPSLSQLLEGRTWSCLKFSGLDFQSEIMDKTKIRSLSFENYGAGIIKEISYGNNHIQLYANDDGELAGSNSSGELYEAIRITKEGDLVLESSVQGIDWWKRFFLSLVGEGRTLRKLLGVVQNSMVTSVSNTKNSGLVFDYSVCPANKIINDVVRR